MADESKGPARSSSSGSSRKAKAKPVTAAAASTTPDSQAEAPAPAAEPASGPAAATAPAPEPTRPVSAPQATAYAPTPTTHAPAAHRPVAAESSASGGVALAGLLAGLLGIVLALTYPQWTPIVYGSSSESRSAAAKVQAESKAEIAVLKATVATLTQKQATLEQAVRTAKLPGILMVAEDLRVALAGSEPYVGTLNLFRALTAGDDTATPIIAAVESRAEVGVPSNEDLRDRFDDAAHAVLVAEQRTEVRGGLASQVSDTVASLAAATIRLRWRLDGAPTGDGVAATVARAELLVGNGDLQGAVDTLGLLPEPRATLVQPWIELVRTRLAAEAVREDLDAYIITTASGIR